MSDKSQSAASHAKMVPGYHYLASVLILFPLLYFASVTVTQFSITHLAFLSLSVGVFVTAFYARVFALGVQDRVIRLEERLRMRRVLPEELHPRIEEVSTEHIIGLRFAPDEELSDLVRRVLDGELSDRKAVKAAIGNWRSDHQRI